MTALLRILLRWCPLCRGARVVWRDTSDGRWVGGEWRACPECREAWEMVERMEGEG